MESLIFTIFRLIMWAIRIYEIALLVYFLMSWIPQARGSSLWNVLASLCEPFVSFFRQFIPAIGGVSFAGIVALLVLGLIQRGVVAIFSFLLNLV